MFELLDLRGGVTPALHVLVENIARSVLQDEDFQAKVLIPILGNESYICTHAFNAYATSHNRHPGHKNLGYEVFKVFLKHEHGFIFSEIVSLSIFSAYWDLAKDDGKYWQPNAQWTHDKYLPYKEILSKWQQENEELMKFYSQELQK